MPNVLYQTTEGGDFGNALGSGLLSGLQMLADSKMNKMIGEQTRKKTVSGLKALNRFNDQEAEAISHLPLDIQKLVIKEKLKGPENKGFNVLGGIGEPGTPLGIQQQYQSLPGQEGIPLGVSSQIAQNYNPEQQKGFNYQFPSAEEYMQQALQQRNPLAQGNQNEQEIAPVTTKKTVDKGTKVRAPKPPTAKKSQEGTKDAGKYKPSKIVTDKWADTVEGYETALKVKNLVEPMLKNIERNKSKFPEYSGYLPDRFQRDKDIRKYATDATNLVTLKSQAQKGRSSDYKTRLLQAGKVELSQPKDTQISILKDLIKDSNDAIRDYEKLYDIKQQYGGQFSQELENELYKPKKQSEGSELEKYAGSEIVQDDSGNYYKWDESEQRYRPAKMKG